MNPKHYEALDGIRAFACIGIVLMHVLANAGYNLHGFVFEDVIPSFTDFVFLFMIISGFGMCCGYYEKIVSNKISIADFYLKRYKKILPFFAFLCLIDLAISPSFEALNEVFANLTLCFGLIPNADISVIGVGWFLGVVFAFYLLFPFYCFLLSNRARAWTSFAAAFILNVLCRIYFKVDRKSIVFCFVYFLAGGLLFLYKENLEKITANKWIVLILLLVLTFSYYCFRESVAISILINSALVLLAMSLSGKNVLNNSFTRLVGGVSFEIYLCHMLIYRVIEKLHALSLVGNELIDYLIVVLFVLIGSFVFAMVSQKMLNRLEIIRNK